MRILEIYCDSDGPITDWRHAVLSLPRFEGWNIDQLNKSPDRESLLRQLYTDFPHFFYKLPIHHDGSRLLEVLMRYHQNSDMICQKRTVAFDQIRVNILTAIGTDHPDYNQASADKREFYHYKHQVSIPVVCVRDSCDKPRVMEHCGKHEVTRVLVDDFRRNCNEWEDPIHEVIYGGRNIALHVDIDESNKESSYDVNQLLGRLSAIIHEEKVGS